MFIFHTDNTAYASCFSVQKNLLKGVKREKNYFKGNMFKKRCLGFFPSSLIYFYLWQFLFLLILIIILLVDKENFQDLKTLML